MVRRRSFPHKHNNYREAIDGFCLRKSRRQKVRVRLCVSSEHCERVANKKVSLIGDTYV